MTNVAGMLLSWLPGLVLYGGFTLVVGLLARGRVRLLGVVGGLLLLLSSFLSTVVFQLLFLSLDVQRTAMGAMATLFELPHWVAVVLIAVALVQGGRSLTQDAGRQAPSTEPPSTAWGSGASVAPQHTPPPDPGHPSGR